MTPEQSPIVVLILLALHEHPGGLSLERLAQVAWFGNADAEADMIGRLEDRRRSVAEVLVGLERAGMVRRWPTWPEAWTLTDFGRDCADVRRVLAARSVRLRKARWFLVWFLVGALLWVLLASAVSRCVA